jgi:hypothetical protein
MKKFTINMDQKVKQFNKEANKTGLFNKIQAYNLIKNCDGKLAKQMRKDITRDVSKLLTDLKFTPESIWQTEVVQKTTKRTPKVVSDVQA